MSIELEVKKEPNEEVRANDWIVASWEQFLEVAEGESQNKTRFYYYQGRYYKEMGVGANHAFVNTVVIILIHLFCMKKNLRIKGYTNCSYRKVGVTECQPDIAYYVGDRTEKAPQSSNVVDLDVNLPPDLMIEIADSSLGYDLGAKRMIYEEVQVKEYWVTDVQNMKVIGFRILEDLGSARITESSVLSGLQLSLLEEALQKSTEMDNSQIGAWFMEQLG